jgi:hypothetical protein
MAEKETEVKQAVFIATKPMAEVSIAQLSITP